MVTETQEKALALLNEVREGRQDRVGGQVMTEAEALDMAAKAAGWEDYNIALYNDGDVESIRAHAATIMENAENARLLSMSAEREINLRGELLRLQRKNAALNAENERLRQAVQVRMDAKHREAAEAKLWFTKAQEWKAEIERLREALELADAALRGANMNMNVVERKVRAALKEIEGDKGF